LGQVGASASCVAASRGVLRLKTTIVLARRPINAAVVGSGELVFGELVCGKACRVLVSFSTPPVQARFPIDAGGVGLTMSRPGNAGTVVVSCGLSMRVHQPSSCRHGAGSTPAAWGGLRQGPVGCGSLRSVGTRLNGAGQGCVRLVGARYENRHRGRRGEASTPRGGMSFGQVGNVMAGQACGMFRLGFFALVIGTTPLRRGRAEFKTRDATSWGACNGKEAR